MELFEIIVFVAEILFVTLYVASIAMRQEPKEKRERFDTLATSSLIMVSVLIGGMPLDNTLFLFLVGINIAIVLTKPALIAKAQKEKQAKDEEPSEKVQEVQ